MTWLITSSAFINIEGDLTITDLRQGVNVDVQSTTDIHGAVPVVVGILHRRGECTAEEISREVDILDLLALIVLYQKSGQASDSGSTKWGLVLDRWSLVKLIHEAFIFYSEQILAGKYLQAMVVLHLFMAWDCVLGASNDSLPTALMQITRLIQIKEYFIFTCNSCSRPGASVYGDEDRIPLMEKLIENYSQLPHMQNRISELAEIGFELLSHALASKYTCLADCKTLCQDCDCPGKHFNDDRICKVCFSIQINIADGSGFLLSSAKLYTPSLCSTNGQLQSDLIYRHLTHTDVPNVFGYLSLFRWTQPPRSHWSIEI